MWQMGGIGPMMGQANHFRRYAPDRIEYATNRYANETKRLFGVADTQLGKTRYLAGGEYTIADMAISPWFGGLILNNLYEAQKFLDVASYEHVGRWARMIVERPAVKRGERVNRMWGPEELRVPERHSAADFKGTD